MSKIGLEALVLCALLFIAGVLGYGFRGDRNQDQIRTANSNFDVCTSAMKGTQAALHVLSVKFTELQTRHEAAMTDSAAALDQRDNEITQLHSAATRRTTSARSAAHVDPDCQTLARLPVCAAVARQLWPAATQTSTGHHPD
jgi:hypothetical protein